MRHRSRVAHFAIDVDLDQGIAFWSAALDAKEEQLSEASSQVCRKLRLPDSEVRILPQRTADPNTHKERKHLDLESDDVEALGATRYDHQQERGYDFWVPATPGTTSSASSRSTSPMSSPSANHGQTHSQTPCLETADPQRFHDR